MSWGFRSKPTGKMPVSELDELLRSMRPRLNAGVYVFISAPPGTDISLLQPIATFREDEGTSLIVEESLISGSDFQVLFRAAWITLTVNSDLNAVGLTATITTVFAEKGISCNVVDDHLFVPIELGVDAMSALVELQNKIAST
jgi:hypothetical protein